MDAVDILKVCFRRWYIMLPILLGAAGVSYQLLQAQETTYTSSASYGLVQTASPSGSAAPSGGTEPNPLGANDGALIGSALEAQLNSRETQQRLGSDATRGWGPGETTNGSSFKVEIPLYETSYEIRAWGEDEQAVRAVVNRVVRAAPGIADQLQDRVGAPDDGRYEPFIFAATQTSALPSTSGKKLVVAVMGVGVLMGAAWSIVADRALRQLRRRRDASRAAAASGPPPDDERDQGAADAPVSPRPADDPTTRLNGSKPDVTPEGAAASEPPEDSSDPEDLPEESSEPLPARPRPPHREPVTTPAGDSPRASRGKGPSDSGRTKNGQRRPQGKASRPRGGGANQSRRTGGK